MKADMGKGSKSKYIRASELRRQRGEKCENKQNKKLGVINREVSDSIVSTKSGSIIRIGSEQENELIDLLIRLEHYNMEGCYRKRTDAAYSSCATADSAISVNLGGESVTTFTEAQKQKVNTIRNICLPLIF